MPAAEEGDGDESGVCCAGALFDESVDAASAAAAAARVPRRKGDYALPAFWRARYAGEAAADARAAPYDWCAWRARGACAASCCHAPLVLTTRCRRAAPRRCLAARARSRQV
jgi:hypothetical protein